MQTHFSLRKAKHLLSLMAIMMVLSFPVLAQQTWNLDKSHSAIRFEVTHLVISTVEGSFKDYNGSIVSSGSDFENAKINFTVKAASINTDNEMRDNHLKSDDFFNTEKFPEIKFQSTSFKKVSGNKYKLTGTLTMRDVTKTVEFDVVYGGTAKDGYGNTKAGFKATGSINRFDYGLKWNAATEAGGAVASAEVDIKLNFQFAMAK